MVVKQSVKMCSDHLLQETANDDTGLKRAVFRRT